MSFQEIAVNPSAIRSWRDFQLVWSKAGFSKGRLISCYPQKGPDKETRHQGWPWRVVESVKEADIGSVKRVQTCLEIYAKFKLMRRGRAFDHAEPWTPNADCEHRRAPFAALIGITTDDCYCSLDDLEGEDCPECLRDDQHVMILPKQPAAFAEGLLPMLSCSNELRFVDPYYLNPSNTPSGVSLSRKHARVVQEIANRMNALQRVPQLIEFHMLSVVADPEVQLKTFAREMDAFLPKTWKAKGYLWTENLGGRRFHARYILTDVGGVGSEYGLDEGNSPGDQTDLYMLPESLRTRRTAEFSLESQAFTLAANPIEFQGTRG